MNSSAASYGVDVVIPHKIMEAGQQRELEQMIPEHHTVSLSSRCSPSTESPSSRRGAQAITGWMHDQALGQVEVAFRHPIKFIANALGAAARGDRAKRALGIKPLRSPASPRCAAPPGRRGRLCRGARSRGRGTLRRGDDHGSRA